jgi:uncharacterized protein
MIPQFPDFKKLELSDKDDVEKFTSKYPPYADHNFLGTLSWDVHEKILISQLNGNYVIRFADYSTGEPFYTYLGNNKVNETAKALLDISKKENIKLELKLIPEVSIEGLDTNIFKIEEDRDNFDYVYDLSLLKDYTGHKFSKKRNAFTAFIKKYPNAKAKEISLRDPNTQKSILKLYDKWFKDKIENDAKFGSHKELIAIEKFFISKDIFNLVSVGVFLDDELIAFCVDELKDSEYAVSHIAKADPLFLGAYTFLMKKSAEILYSNGKRYLDYEQDLGIPNMRLAKSLFQPCFFLKKYKLSYLH